MSERRKVDLIEWCDGKASDYSTETKQLYYWEEHFGEYGIPWVTAEKDGKEISRYNAGHLTAIHFAKE